MLRKQNLCPSSKICFRNIVSRAAKLGNICLLSNVSATMFPSLARPLKVPNEVEITKNENYDYKLQYNVILTLGLSIKSQGRAAENQFPVVLFMMLYGNKLLVLEW